MKRIFLILSTLLMLASCFHEEDYVIDVPGPVPFSIQDAQACFETSQSYLKTKSFSEDTLLSNFFYRGGIAPLWDKAVMSHSRTQSWLDIPIEDKSGYDYYVIAFDSFGFYWTKCYHSIAVIKNRETSTVSFYNHFIIPGRKMVDKYGVENCGEELFYSFLTNEEKDDYDGMELFTNMKGEVVVFDRYFNGHLYEHVSIFDEYSEIYNYMKWALNCYLARMYRVRSEIKDQLHTKAAVNNAVFSRCPYCHSEDLIELPNGNYVCTNCWWSYDGVLDGGYVSGSWPYEDDDPEEPYTPTPETEPGNGGSSAGHRGGAGNPGSNTSYHGFVTDPSFDTYVKPNFDILYNECIGKFIIDSIARAGANIRFQAKSDVAYMYYSPRAGYELRNSTIYYNPDSERTVKSILVEELFHVLQVMNGTYRPKSINAEIEAKMAAYLIFRKNNGANDGYIYFFRNEYNRSFEAFINNPSEDNYKKMFEFVAPNYMGFTDYSDNHTFKNLGLFLTRYSNCSGYDTTEVKKLITYGQ